MKTLVREYSTIPISSYFLREGAGVADAGQGFLLETYFNDIYHLFLNKLVRLTHESTISDDEVLKLRQLLEEVIKVKVLIQKGE